MPPIKQPSTKLMATPPKPTKSETRAAIMVRENRSRLTESVPKSVIFVSAIYAEEVQIQLKQAQN